MPIDFIAATFEHSSLLANAVLSANEGDSRPSLYHRLFGVNEEFELGLEKILQSPGDDEPLGYKSFLVAVEGGAPIAACASWVEKEMPSSIQSSLRLKPIIPFHRWRESRRRLAQFASIMPSRTPGSVQIASVYVLPNMRGRQVAGRTIRHLMSMPRYSSRSFEMIVLNENISALNAYRKLGFEPWAVTQTADSSIAKLIGGTGYTKLRLGMMRESR